MQRSFNLQFQASNEVVIMDKKMSQLTITLAIVLGVIVVGIFMLTAQRVEGNFDCKFHDIELRDVSPGQCWGNDFIPEQCPIPKNIECSGRAELPSYMLGVVGG